MTDNQLIRLEKILATIFGAIFTVRFGFGILMVVASILFAQERNFDFASSFMILCFLFMSVGSLPFMVKPLEIKFGILGIVVSLMWLIFSGFVTYNQVYDPVSSYMLVWLAVAVIILTDLPLLALCFMFLVPGNRKLLLRLKNKSTNLD